MRQKFAYSRINLTQDLRRFIKNGVKMQMFQLSNI